MVTVACSNAKCGRTFQRHAAHVRKAKSSYCSKQCLHASMLRGVVSGANAGIRAAHAAGYRALPDGSVVDPCGAAVNLKAHKKTGYWSFSARGCASPLSLHRFIAFQIFGEAALAAECVRHLNDDRNDNRFDNLEPGTKSQNQFDIPAEKRSLMGVRRNAKRRRFSADQVREIRQRLSEGWSLKRLRAVYDCAFGTVARIRDGLSYREVA